MVVEQAFKARWLEKRPRYAFLLGVLYTIIGIASAKLIFSSNIGLMSIAFTSILLLPSLNKLLQDEENVEIREKKLSLKLLFKDHKDIFEIYFFLFLGIFLTYAFITIAMPLEMTERIFPAQLEVGGILGAAVDGFEDFLGILSNNLIVLVVCLALSLIYGAGSILFITWNASAWGIIIGYLAKESVGANPLSSFLVLLIPILPHLITEATSYFSAAIVGGVVSKAALREPLFSKKFHHILTDAVIFLVLGFILVVIAAYIEVFVVG